MDTRCYCHLIEFATPEFDEALKLRFDILIKPLKIEISTEDIASEYDSLHLGCYTMDKHELIGVLVLKPLNTSTIKMRQVAVETKWQSKGIGNFMVIASEKIAIGKGYTKIELNARDNAVPFYEKMGYSKEGPKFVEVGIDHYFMFKNLL